MNNLKQIRIEKGLTQQHLADKLKISKQMISKYESGDKIPSLKRVMQLAKELECTIEELYKEEV